MTVPEQTNLSIIGMRRSREEAIQLALVVALVLVPAAVPRILLWPVALMPVFGIYAVMARRNDALLRPPTWLRAGRVNGPILLMTAVFTLASCMVLLAWNRMAHPNLSAHLARVPDRAVAAMILSGMIFALLNAFIEETVFRGLLQTLATERFGVAFAILLQAILFGLGHYAGVPSGWLGVVMATVYGLGLGLLRKWTGGIAACTLSHIALDATIFAMVANNA